MVINLFVFYYVFNDCNFYIYVGYCRDVYIVIIWIIDVFFGKMIGCGGF